MKKLAVASALALASLALVACGSSSSTQSQGNNTVKIKTVPSGLEYTTDSATAEAGKVTIDFDNTQTLTHDVTVEEDSSGKTVGGTERLIETSESTVLDLKPGTYTYYCSIPGHREAGMEGTLTVE
jgi:plastocyanin